MNRVSRSVPIRDGPRSSPRPSSSSQMKIPAASPSSPVWNSEKVHGLAFHNQYDQLHDLLLVKEHRKLLLKEDFMLWNALIFATQRNNFQIVKLILSYPEGRESLSVRTRGGNNVLHFAVSSKAVEILREVLLYPEGRKLLHCKNAQGFTASSRNQSPEMDFMLKHELSSQILRKKLLRNRAQNNYNDLEIVCVDSEE